jgi:hypothetical protein
VMRLTNAKCIWSMQSSMRLSRTQAEAIAGLEPRRSVVHYTLHPDAFEVEIPLVEFPPKPSKSELRWRSEEVSKASRWTCGEPEAVKAAPAIVVTPNDLAGDALRVMVRICEEPAEPIEQRCETLRMDRSREFRARGELDGRGLIAKLKQTIAKKMFFQPTDKGLLWASEHKIRVKKFKSGIIHEYVLCQVEKGIGVACQMWRLQRNSSIARHQGLQPDLLVLGPKGQRVIVEVCCNNLDYDAQNILAEAGIPEVDKLVAVAPDKRTKKSLQQALAKRLPGAGDLEGSVVVLDAAECLADGFDWKGLLAKS